MAPEPTAAVIEILERGAQTEDTLGGSVILPNEVRINGHPVAMPPDARVAIEEITFGQGETILVTLTLIARRVVIGAERDVASGLSGPKAGSPTAAADLVKNDS